MLHCNTFNKEQIRESILCTLYTYLYCDMPYISMIIIFQTNEVVNGYLHDNVATHT